MARGALNHQAAFSRSRGWTLWFVIGALSSSFASVRDYVHTWWDVYRYQGWADHAIDCDDSDRQRQKERGRQRSYLFCCCTHDRRLHQSFIANPHGNPVFLGLLFDFTNSEINWWLSHRKILQILWINQWCDTRIGFSRSRKAIQLNSVWNRGNEFSLNRGGGIWLLSS